MGDGMRVENGLPGGFAPPVAPVAAPPRAAVTSPIDAYCGGGPKKAPKIASGGGFRVGGPFLPCPFDGFIERPVDQPLTVNTSKKHYFSQRTRAQGEKDLQALASNPKGKEESFIFFEGVDKDDKPISFWFEVGEYESRTRVCTKNSAEFIKRALSIFKAVTGMSQYHIHPVDTRYVEGVVGIPYPSPQDIGNIFSTITGDAQGLMGYPYDVLDERVVNSRGVFVIKADRGAILSAKKEEVSKYLKNYASVFNEYAARNDEVLEETTTWQDLFNEFSRAVSSPHLSFRFILL